VTANGGPDKPDPGGQERHDRNHPGINEGGRCDCRHRRRRHGESPLTPPANPSFGVGAGNVPVIIDNDADLKDAAAKIVMGRVV